MFRLFYIMIMVLPGSTIYAQNLVPNNDFEDYNDCPRYVSGIWQTSGYGPFVTVDYWRNPCKSTSDYFNECATLQSRVNIPNTFAGYHYAYSGKGMVGIHAYQHVKGQSPWNEYVQCKLTSKLQQGKKYYVSFYVKYSNYTNPDLPFNTNYPIDKVGAHFSANMLNDNVRTYLEGNHHVVNPAGRLLSDTANWMWIYGTYDAKGDEEFMTIGSFEDGFPVKVGNTDSMPDIVYNYYFIDIVSVSDVPPVIDTVKSLVLDTTICSLEPFEFTAKPQSEDMYYTFNYLWNTGATQRGITISAPGTYWRVAYNDFECFVDTYRVRSTLSVNVRKHTADVCAADTVISSGFDNYLSCNWSTGEMQSSLTVAASGQYICVTEFEGCRFNIDTFDLNILNLGIGFSLGADTIICREDKIPIGQEVKNADYYIWNTGYESCCFIPETAGKYILTVSNRCYSVSDDIVIDTIRCENCFFVPTAFTPNGDGLNDILSVIDVCKLNKIDFRVYDRWGSILFKTTSATEKWDGTHNGYPAEMGVYYYYLHYYSPERKKDVLLKGDITLIR